MHTVGIICEYNPLHKGHSKQFSAVRAAGAEGIVCLMSGNFVQRGAPAIFEKSLRARAAVECGADLVLELPVTVALNSAEGFASGGVSLLGGFCDYLCFGAETEKPELLTDLAKALLSEEFPAALRSELDTGKSFPAARSAALIAMGYSGEVLCQPNNILAVEYCKAILSQGCRMQPMPIHRQGSYHADTPDSENPSATALRRLILQGQDWEGFVPDAAKALFSEGSIHSLRAGERAVLARLRTMTDAEFEALPHASEGLWRKLMHAVGKEPDLESIATAVKSKRYTRSRIDRMILCAFLGLTAEDFAAPAPYARVLAFNHKGREILKQARQTGCFPNLGEKTGHPYEVSENRCDRLYGLFAQSQPEISGKQRVQYII